MNAPPLFTIPPPAPDQARGPAWPLWAVSIVGVLVGSAVLLGSVSAAAARVPVLTTVSGGVFAAFAALCVWVLGRIPYFDPIRRDTVVLAMVWGGAAAAGFAILGNTAVYDSAAANSGAVSWSLVAPFVEEPLKDLGIVVVLLLAIPQPRTALDGLVTGSFVGLGFETAENVIQSLNNALSSPDQWASLTTDVVHEVLRRSWTGHIVITGIAGFGIAYAMTQRRAPRRWQVAAGLVALALAGHLLWNSPRFGVFYVLGQFGSLALYLWLVRVGRAQEARLYVPYLGYAPALVDPGLADAMRSGATRKAYRQAAPNGCSRQTQRAIARLAAAIGNGEVGAAHAAAEQVSSVRRS